MKFRTYKGEVLMDALVTIKVDGVRAHGTGSGAVSREGKPLHNVALPEGAVAEVFCGSWEATISAVRTQDGQPVAEEHVYVLRPELDERLVIGRYDTLTESGVGQLFDRVRSQRYEGLVIYSGGQMYKVKGEETYDVPVTKVIPGKGRLVGLMGVLETPMGKVHAGFSDADRAAEWATGMVIEVACTELTPSGKFRHARFIRRRFDKE
jgi:hypothetical protein